MKGQWAPLQVASRWISSCDGRDFIAIEVKARARLASFDLSGLRAIGESPGVKRRILVHTRERAFNTEDGLDWAVAPDGESFLVVEGGDASKSPPHINVVVNWFEELRTLAPVGTIARPPGSAP